VIGTRALRGVAPAGGPIRAAFVMEQTLGNVTHYRNLRDVMAEQTELAPTWLPIPFDVHGPARLVPLLRSNWSVRASWRARRALGAALAARRHDALFFHTQTAAIFSVGAMRSLPTVVSLDATPIKYDSVGHHYGHRPAGDGWIDRQKYRLTRRVFHAAARLVARSEWARQSLVDDYGVDPARIRVIAQEAAPAYFEIGQRRQLGNARSSSEDGLVRLLFVGGDFRRKGGPSLLECMRGSLADRCELHLVTQEAMPPQRNVHVHRGLGPNSADLLRLFAEADAFILPTMADCLPVVLMEATAAGLPIVTTDVGALAEAVRDGESGILVRAGDARALQRAVEVLVGDAQLRHRMGRAGHALARQKFDVHRNGRALLDLLLEVAQAGRRSREAA
jgi:glycosyltransferase involved in cell wall biosynthesis